MEARVDVRKLQVLNDRINQTIDALNQVRLSVHGLGHTGGMQPQVNPLNFLQGYGQQQPFIQGQFPGIGGQIPGFQQQGVPGIGQSTGFQHSPFTPYANPFVNPGMLTPWGVSAPTVGLPWGGLGGGLYHSSADLIERQLVEAKASDPYRISQTFPFVIT